MSRAHPGLGQRSEAERPLTLEEVATSLLMITLSVFLMTETRRIGVHVLAMGGLIWGIYPLVTRAA